SGKEGMHNNKYEKYTTITTVTNSTNVSGSVSGSVSGNGNNNINENKNGNINENMNENKNGNINENMNENKNGNINENMNENKKENKKENINENVKENINGHNNSNDSNDNTTNNENANDSDQSDHSNIINHSIHNSDSDDNNNNLFKNNKKNKNSSNKQAEEVNMSNDSSYNALSTLSSSKMVNKYTYNTSKNKQQINNGSKQEICLENISSSNLLSNKNMKNGLYHNEEEIKHHKKTIDLDVVKKNIQLYNNFIKTNEEMKHIRNEYKSIIQTIDSFIGDNINSQRLNNVLNIENDLKNHENLGEDKKNEKKNFTTNNSTSSRDNSSNNDESMKIIDDVSSEHKNKYIILKYDEDSLIEALEKLRINKQKRLKEEEERKKAEKEKTAKEKAAEIKTKIDKDIFFKCNKKEYYEKAKSILNQSNYNKILIDKFNVALLYSQIKCLINNNWLNDEVINFYLSILQEYNQDGEKRNQYNLPKIYTFSTFFYQSLSMNGSYNYNKVSRWTKRKKVDIFTYDLILIPLHIGGNHWTLGAIDMKNKKIKLYDSLNKQNKNFFYHISQYVVDEMMDKKNIKMTLDDWQYDKEGKSEQGIPQQHNGYDCGVFTCMFAKCLSFNREFDFNQQDIREIRLKMVYEISQGCLVF
ncbi:sentrin-specific protease 1, putative, partial [Hepatocystis sp. ex Piliocolobus tephrosceles]